MYVDGKKDVEIKKLSITAAKKDYKAERIARTEKRI
jgi:hypothetical protein